ncbi:MAG: hypothetical protein KDA90_01350 [Planctomycetaceae bacterium]|nr:hypothetical protein [Planctomycetaceae bacterium]
MAGLKLTVRDLRRQWKPHKQRLSLVDPGHSSNVRFHRACSWLQRCEQIHDDSELDLALLSQWTAFNALYGQWDSDRSEPLPDRASWRQFLDRILQLDESQFLVDALQENKPLVMSIYDDEYLSGYFWEDPTEVRAKKSKKTKFEAQTWYLHGNWILILERLVERIYFLRCQLVHGAATFNSSLNRVAIRRCTQMMEHLLQAILLTWITHGADEEWGAMCYPPKHSSSPNRAARSRYS